MGAGYFGTYGSILISKTWKISYQYSYMKINGEHKISYNNEVQNNLYSIRQKQYYFSPSAYLGNGFFMEPYFNYINSNTKKNLK